MEKNTNIIRVPYDITPVSDDRPFFFAYHKWRTLLDRIESQLSQLQGRGPGGAVYPSFGLARIGLLVGILVLLPLFVFHRKGLEAARPRPGLLLLLCHRRVLFSSRSPRCKSSSCILGHPTYSISIVLFTFLLFSGLGSLFGQRFSHTTPFGYPGLAVLPIVVLLILFISCFPPVFASRCDFPI